jgi:hypothetical protein
MAEEPKTSFAETGRQLDAAIIAEEEFAKFVASVGEENIFADMQVELKSLHPGSRYLEEALVALVTDDPRKYIREAGDIIRKRRDVLTAAMEKSLSPSQIAARQKAAGEREQPPPGKEAVDAATEGTSPGARQTNESRRAPKQGAGGKA